MAQIKDLELIKDINILLQNNVVIYGGGNYGKLAVKELEEAGIPVYCACDSSAEKWGETLEGKVNIISPMELGELRKNKNIVVIISINSPQQIKQVLKMLDYCGMKDLVCYTYFGLTQVLSFRTAELGLTEFERRKKEYLTSMLAEGYVRRVSCNTVHNLLTSNPILVYQSTKVGSVTVHASLYYAGVNAEHIHYLNGSWYKPLSLKKINFDIEQKQEERDLLRNLEKVKIITLVREPISRDISFFFQLVNYNLAIKERYHLPDMLTAINRYIDDFSNFEKLGYQFEWFNHEIKEVFGVDIYNYEFDKERGYQIIYDKNVEILAIKMEKLSQCEEIIGQFANLKDFKLNRGNSASDKLYSFAYEEVKEQIRIPRKIVDRYYKNNPAMDHFYTENEKAAFLKRWEKNIVD